MTAVISRSRSTSTWLTGAAGLLLLAAAFVMMICAGPRVRPPLHTGASRPVTESVITYCGQSACTPPGPVRAASLVTGAWRPPCPRAGG